MIHIFSKLSNTTYPHLLIPFKAILATLLNELSTIKRTTKKPGKLSHSLLPDHIGFYGTVWKSTLFYSIPIFVVSWFEK